MRWKRVCVFVVIASVSLFLFKQDRVFPADAFFTHHDIKRQILRAIEESKDAIDIAVSDITSKEILNALEKAQERGVQVRIVVDRKRALMRGPLSNLYKDKEVAIRVFIQKGLMHNNFAIFDYTLLLTGSYHWNEKVSKFNRDNAIFTDDTKVLVKYQREFDRLFHEAITPGVKEAAPAAKKEIEEVESEPVAIVPKTKVTEEHVVAANYGVVITQTEDGYINMNFEEFNNIFGMASELSDEQKESLWSRCAGKKIRWKGRVNYIGWGLITGWMMSVNHGDTSVEIKLNSSKKEHFSHVKYGNTVTYTGKLDSRVTRVFPYKLEDGDVLEIEDTLPRPLSNDELIESPDVVPVSQGPKKIFLVESFEDLDNIFGKGSNLSDGEKKEAWGKYVGKYVSWMGQIVHKNLNIASGLRIRIMQNEDGYVELKVGLAKKDKVLKFQDGETVVYTGKLAERCGIRSPYVLEDGDIMTMK